MTDSTDKRFKTIAADHSGTTAEEVISQLREMIHRGDLRLHELVTKYGAARVASNMKSLQDYSERMMRASIAKLPPGVYRFEDGLDSDGLTDKPVRIRVAITIRGDSAVVDFTGSDPQADNDKDTHHDDGTGMDLRDNGPGGRSSAERPPYREEVALDPAPAIGRAHRWLGLPVPTWLI